MRATGGVITIVGDYTYHTGYSTFTFHPLMDGDIKVECWGAGGGSGGALGWFPAGGGGGGGYASSTIAVTVRDYACVVGAGGARGAGWLPYTVMQNRAGRLGNDSTFDGSVVIARGGGPGQGGVQTNAGTGGEGGGQYSYYGYNVGDITYWGGQGASGAHTVGMGYYGGGGGGSSAGTNSTGNMAVYTNGAGGPAPVGGVAGANGGPGDYSQGTDGTPGGGGAGGGGTNSYYGGTGGSGLVRISYRTQREDAFAHINTPKDNMYMSIS